MRHLRRVVLVCALTALALGAGVGSARAASPRPADRAALAQLARLGADGRAAAAFAAQTAPRVVRGQDLSGVSASSSLSAVARALSGTGSGGMGFPLPALLIATATAAAGYGMWRYRQRSE